MRATGGSKPRLTDGALAMPMRTRTMNAEAPTAVNMASAATATTATPLERGRGSSTSGASFGISGMLIYYTAHRPSSCATSHKGASLTRFTVGHAGMLLWTRRNVGGASRHHDRDDRRGRGRHRPHARSPDWLSPVGSLSHRTEAR